nr:50S ribosomal protein L28 [uncultured archaeon]
MNVSHSHRRTKKRSLPNLHVITVRVAGRNQTMRLCTKCTRIIRAQYPFKTDLPAGRQGQEIGTEKKTKKETQSQTQSQVPEPQEEIPQKA